MASMRAVVAERPDGPDGLVLREVPRPEPRPGWALVKVEAFGLNRSEYKTLKGYAGDAVTFPRILGIELVGVVDAVHGDTPAAPPGTIVAALMGDGPRVRRRLRRVRARPRAPADRARHDCRGHRRMAANEAIGKLVVLPHAATT